MTPQPRPVLRDLGSGRLVPPIAPRALGTAVVATLVFCIVMALSEPRTSAPGSPARDRVAPLLAMVDVVPDRVPVPGYERDCSGSSACVFGPAWSDTTGAPGSGNGCPTRYDVLARDLVGTTVDPASPCTVHGGILTDPYTGRVVDVGHSGIRGIHVDHVFPLSAAWDLGASRWPAQRRAAFANDVDRNLVAVTGSVNTTKSDSTPAEWLPPDPTRHCFYAARYLSAAAAYDLPVTAADHAVLETAIRRCPRGG